VSTNAQPNGEAAGLVFNGLAVLASVLLVIQLLPAAFLVAFFGWWAALVMGTKEETSDQKSIQQGRKALFRIAVYCSLVSGIALAVLLLALAGESSFRDHLFAYRFGSMSAGIVIFAINFVFGIFFLLSNLRGFYKTVNQGGDIDRDSLPSAYRQEK
jgi:hypothetical protein